jgi:hypothetical protein
VVPARGRGVDVAEADAGPAAALGVGRGGRPSGGCRVGGGGGGGGGRLRGGKRGDDAGGGAVGGGLRRAEIGHGGGGRGTADNTSVRSELQRERVVLTTPRCGAIGKQEEEAAAGRRRTMQTELRETGEERGKKNGVEEKWWGPRLEGGLEASKNGG